MRSRLSRRHRRAAAAVEMAIVTPILLTMLFGIIEYGWLFTVRQGVITAAREGARTATLPGAEEEDVRQRVEDYMEPLGLTSFSTDVELDSEGYPTGTVTVSIPLADVTLVGGFFGNGEGTISATCAMKKEGID